MFDKTGSRIFFDINKSGIAAEDTSKWSKAKLGFTKLCCTLFSKLTGKTLIQTNDKLYYVSKKELDAFARSNNIIGTTDKISTKECIAKIRTQNDIKIIEKKLNNWLVKSKEGKITGFEAPLQGIKDLLIKEIGIQKEKVETLINMTAVFHQNRSDGMLSADSDGFEDLKSSWNIWVDTVQGDLAQATKEKLFTVSTFLNRL